MKNTKTMDKYEVENDLGVKCEFYTNEDSVKYYPNKRGEIIISKYLGDKETEEKDMDVESIIKLIEKLGFSVDTTQDFVIEGDNYAEWIVDKEYFIDNIYKSFDEITISLKGVTTVDSYYYDWEDAYCDLFDKYKDEMRKSKWYLEYKNKWNTEVKEFYKEICENENYLLLSKEQKEKLKDDYLYLEFDNYICEEIEFDWQGIWSSIVDNHLKPEDIFSGEFEEDDEYEEKLIKDHIEESLDWYISNQLIDDLQELYSYSD